MIDRTSWPWNDMAILAQISLACAESTFTGLVSQAVSYHCILYLGLQEEWSKPVTRLFCRSCPILVCRSVLLQVDIEIMMSCPHWSLITTFQNARLVWNENYLYCGFSFASQIVTHYSRNLIQRLYHSRDHILTQWIFDALPRNVGSFHTEASLRKLLSNLALGV